MASPALSPNGHRHFALSMAGYRAKQTPVLKSQLEQVRGVIDGKKGNEVVQALVDSGLSPETLRSVASALAASRRDWFGPVFTLVGAGSTAFELRRLRPGHLPKVADKVGLKTDFIRREFIRDEKIFAKLGVAVGILMGLSGLNVICNQQLVSPKLADQCRRAAQRLEAEPPR